MSRVPQLLSIRLGAARLAAMPQTTPHIDSGNGPSAAPAAERPLCLIFCITSAWLRASVGDSDPRSPGSPQASIWQFHSPSRNGR